ncbi:putative galactose oxidase/kelch, beta-propeller [Rosa chinensis]|uniref:Putative galactose oxidase/kelch, beta-propeller n=1 Tax=Rosa chinensis TaxID=74649 RepID=A0A2P6S9L7_ROSCH|nr:uncharacterized protein LOC121051864 [Rosa chinensis]PRQ55346.1 putative galactose oxidase/kelch, beta-propeller [Rosa chinensis]
MGMRARLGLGIARDLKQHMNKTLSFTRNKSSCSATAAAAASEKKKEEEKSLYIYFKEETTSNKGVHDCKHRTRFPIRSVKLSYLLSPSSSTKTNIDDDPNISDEVLPDLRETRRFRTWVRSSPHMLFTAPAPAPRGGGPGFSLSYASQICSLRSKAKVLNKNFPVIKRMKKNEDELLFLEEELPADGKLYCLSANIFVEDSQVFQVLDTKSKKWLSLEAPPGTQPSRSLCFRSAVFGTKVLLWYENNVGVYCFDVTQPEKGWSSTPPSLGNCIPFLNCRSPFVLEHDSNNNFLMFTFDPVAHDHPVKVFLMSHPCDTLQPLNQPLQFPEVPDMPSNFWNVYPLHYEFVHLGGQKICLVLHKFFYILETHTIPGYQHMSLPQLEEISFRGRNKGNLILITFEYEINFESLDIEYRVLTTRHLEYTGKRDPKSEFSTFTTRSMLAGATVL